MGLNATLTTFVSNTIIHSADVNTNFSNLNAVTAIYDVTNNANQVIGHALLGSSDSGMYDFTYAISIGSSIGVTHKFGNYWNGSADKFSVTVSFPAYQLGISGAGIAGRKSNANCVAGNTITWDSWSVLFS